MGTKKVAIACQGGGTHAAFTWGVLTQILRTKQQWDADGNGETFDIAAFSGTSAGALNALAVWYGLTPNTADPACGSIEKAIERLDFLWKSFAAKTPVESAHNTFVRAALMLREKGLPLPGSGPYDVLYDLSLASLSMLGARPEYLSFSGLLDLLCPHFQNIDWSRVAETKLRLVAGAIEILSGNFELFDSYKTLEQLGLMPVESNGDQYSVTRWRMRRPISLEGVAASGTLPEVLPAKEIDGMVFPTCNPGTTVTRKGYYWDGLYSQNPPVRDLLQDIEKADKPDEVWVIRINSQEFHPLSTDIGLENIKDRVNALAGNLSLNQELDHILTINDLLKKYGDQFPELSNRKIVQIRTIKMTRETAWSLHHTSKLDRDSDHLAKLYDEGLAVAGRWLAEWREQGDNFASYPNDARYAEGA